MLSIARIACIYEWEVYLFIVKRFACATRDLEWGGAIVPAEQVQNAYMAALDGNFANVMKADAWIMK